MLTLHHTVCQQVLRGVLGHFLRTGDDQDPRCADDSLAILTVRHPRRAGGAEDQGGGRERQRTGGWKCPVDAAGERACV